MSRDTIVVGMSGGVDSSVAALLLLEQGYDVQGLFMKNWEEDDDQDYCAAAVDLQDAQAVCDRLGIPLHTVNFSAEYWDRVFQYFLDEYRAGRTPNPDVLCNREIKFRAFLDHAQSLGASRIATGHYARIEAGDDGHRLLQGRDSDKDQSYFLYLLNQHQLAHSLFPLGGHSKSEVRALARRTGFATAGKKDSTGICFIGERRFRDFLQRYLPARPGAIESPEGDYLGEHQGLMYYTIGQRQGLGLGGRQGTAALPWYVAGKDLEHNTLIVAQGHDHPLLHHRALRADQLHWIQGSAPRRPIGGCAARIRYRQALQPCEITELDGTTFQVRFAASQWAITPGQSVVFYQGDTCLGGGIITDALGS